jgi:hydroxymethylpyrimidine kinase/phosphomethylpyrimidine kinase
MNVLPGKTTVPLVLSAAGLDPSGGAGVYADIKTFSALNVWGMGVITTMTNQDGRNFKSLKPVDADYFSETMENIFSSHKISAFKIGLITDAFQVEKIADCIQRYKPGIVVLDPVITSSTGFNFWDEGLAKLILEKLLPIVDAVTPNYKESVAILKAAGHSDAEIINRKEIARLIQRQFRCKVALTGGDIQHSPSQEHEGKVEDIFFDGLELKHRIGNYIDIPSHLKHGTGCTFSSALAAHIAKGDDFISACFRAAAFVEQSLNNIMVFGRNNGGIDQNASCRGGDK